MSACAEEAPLGLAPPRPELADSARSAPLWVERDRELDVPLESEAWNREAPVPAGLRWMSFMRISASRDLPSLRVM